MEGDETIIKLTEILLFILITKSMNGDQNSVYVLSCDAVLLWLLLF